MRGALLLAIFLPALFAGCDVKRPNPAEAESKLGNYPALATAERSDQIKTITKESFTDTKVACRSAKELADDLWQITKGQMSASGNPRLVNWGVEEVALKDGSGKIVVLAYSFEPGDPGAITNATDHYLVSSDCRPLHWAYADDAKMIGE